MTKQESFDGLYSQTQIRHLMKTEFSRAKRYKYELTCLLLEISGIGAFRDQFGFDAKEDLCADFVKHLRVETRSCDYCPIPASRAPALLWADSRTCSAPSSCPRAHMLEDLL